MKQLAIAVFFGCAALAASAPPAQGQLLLFDYVGFDYESPDPNGAAFGEAGSGYNGIGLVPGLFAPLVFDQTNNAYTYQFTNLTVSGETAFGVYRIIEYSGPGTLNVYEDSKTTGTLADYGTNPPNATAPSTFTDGTLFLAGALTNFRFVLNTSTNTGSFEAAYEVTGGSQFGNIPPDRRTGWTFAGSTGNATSIPNGYYHQIDGQVFLQEPSPTRTTSWGRLKATYR